MHQFFPVGGSNIVEVNILMLLKIIKLNKSFSFQLKKDDK